MHAGACAKQVGQALYILGEGDFYENNDCLSHPHCVSPSFTHSHAHLHRAWPGDQCSTGMRAGGRWVLTVAHGFLFTGYSKWCQQLFLHPLGTDHFHGAPDLSSKSLRLDSSLCLGFLAVVPLQVLSWCQGRRMM